MECVVLRLEPGQKLKASLLEACATANYKAVSVLSCVGSLQQCTLRLANATAGVPNDFMEINTKREILSLVGTLSADGQCHLHTSLGDAVGNVVGGHLIEGEIFTTAEVTLGVMEGVAFTRPLDPNTGFDELYVQPLSDEGPAKRIRLADDEKRELLTADDKGAIADVIHLYLHHLDSGSAEAFSQLWAEDATCEVKKINKVVRGRAELGAFCSNLHSKFKGASHWEGNVVISRKGPTVSNASYWKALMYNNIIASGKHEDTFVKIDGQWLFQSRVIIHFADAAPS